jgi:hypothetical protein
MGGDLFFTLLSEQHPMFSSKAFVRDVFDIPAHWIFQHYLELEELTGQSVKIRSLFNPEDKTPSMYIYVDKGVYRFKDFSTGNSGSAVDLMKQLWKTDINTVSERIRADYGEFLASGKKPKPIEKTRHVTWKVGGYGFRKWNTDDAAFWTAFNIGSEMLQRHRVYPLEYYYMTKTKGEDLLVEQFKNIGKHMYGFFNAANELYKIYQPFSKSAKYIKIRNHIQGIDQLEGHDNLCLISSLKDMMAMKSITKIKSDYLAPDSENTFFSGEQIQEWMGKYKSIVTFMDADDAGIKSMKHYEKEYKIPFVYVPIENDPALIIKHHGPQKAFYEIAPVMMRAAEKYRKEYEDLHEKLYIL